MRGVETVATKTTAALADDGQLFVALRPGAFSLASLTD